MADKPTGPHIPIESIPDAKIVKTASPAPFTPPSESASAVDAYAGAEARLRLLEAEIKELTKGRKRSMPEPKYEMVEIHVPFACYINGEMFLGKCEVPENVAKNLQSMLSNRKDHDTRLQREKAPTDFEVGSIRRHTVTKVRPDVVSEAPSA